MRPMLRDQIDPLTAAQAWHDHIGHDEVHKILVIFKHIKGFSTMLCL